MAMLLSQPIRRKVFVSHFRADRVEVKRFVEEDGFILLAIHRLQNLQRLSSSKNNS
jgi:hypothetical protein